MSSEGQTGLSPALAEVGDVLVKRLASTLSPMEFRIASARFFGEPLVSYEKLADRHNIAIRKIIVFETRAWNKIYSIDDGFTLQEIMTFRNRKSEEQARVERKPEITESRPVIEPDPEAIYCIKETDALRRPVLSMLAKHLSQLPETDRNAFIAYDVLCPGSAKRTLLENLHSQHADLTLIRRRAIARLKTALGREALQGAIEDLQTMQQTRFMQP